jgi:hypothetical protein
MYLLSRSNTKTIYLLSTSTLKLLNFRVLPLTRRKTGRASHLHHLLLTLLSSSLFLFFFSNYYDISGWILVLYRQSDPSVVTHGASRPATAVARGVRTWRRGVRRHVRATLRAHSWRLLPPWATALSLTSWATTADVYFCKICGGTKNRDKINMLKNSPFLVVENELALGALGVRLWGWPTRQGTAGKNVKFDVRKTNEL